MRASSFPPRLLFCSCHLACVEGLGRLFARGTVAFWAKNARQFRLGTSFCTREARGGPWHMLSGIRAQVGPKQSPCSLCHRSPRPPAELCQPTVPASGGQERVSRSCLWNSRFVKPLTLGQGLLTPPGSPCPVSSSVTQALCLNPCFVRRELTRTPAPAP